MIRIYDEVKDAQSIAISGHVRPDGDCVGSCMGMYLFLKKVFPEKKIDVYLDTPSAIFNIISGVDKIKRADGTRHNYDVCIALDCNKERLGDAAPIFEGAAKSINIDHHISNEGEGDVNYIVPEASSASELVYDVIDKDQIDVEIAKALYIGIIHDTGVLKYSNVSPKTLRIVAQLIEFDFDFPSLIDETFYEKSYVQNQILGRALLESILILDKKCIVSYLNDKTLQFYGVTGKDLDGIVNQLKFTKGVDTAIFMYDTEPDTIKVSLRSNGVIDCSKVAVTFGGGGHVRAAGCSLTGNFYSVVNRLSEQIANQYLPKQNDD